MIASVLSCALALAHADRPPDILFVFADDHAAQAISAYGSRLIETPNIDRLAREGMLFRNAFCGNSICAPSRATVLTGKHTHAHGVIDNGSLFDGTQTTLPRLLQTAGYQTAMIGKWHLKTPPVGFDHYEVLFGQGPYYNPRTRTEDGERRHLGYTTDVLTDLAIQWLEQERDPARPFLLCWWHKAPHREWLPAARHARMFEGEDLPEPETLFDDYRGRASGAANQEMTLREHLTPLDLKFTLPKNLTVEQEQALRDAYAEENAAFEREDPRGDDLVRWRYQRYVKDYLRSVRAVDEGLGRVLDWLDRRDLAKNTLVIYSSDQGFYLGEHGWYDKRWMYEQSLRMPLIVRWPARVAAGSVDLHLVQNIDFAPTLLHAAGVDVPGEMQGESLLPLLLGVDPPNWRRSIYYHYYEFPGVHAVPRHVGVRTATHKLIHYYELGEWELFDLERDSHELSSRHDDPGYASVRADLERELERLQDLYGDRTVGRARGDIRQEFFLARARDPRVELLARGRVGAETAPAWIDPTWKSLTVGARVEGGVDGVIASIGGETRGLSLYVQEGRPVFCVREGGDFFEARADLPLSRGRIHFVLGTLDRGERLRVSVDGEIVAESKGSFLRWMPRDPLTVGADPGSPVGRYAAPHGFKGALADVRVYRGIPGPDILASWRDGLP